MKRRNALLAVLAMVLVLGMSMAPAWAYFTATTSADGRLSVDVGSTTTIREPELTKMEKHVVISSDEDSEPVFIRARAFAGSQYTLDYSGSGWTQGSDGWWYYGPILNSGESAAELLVRIGNIPADPEVGDSFNVTVVHEATPVQYNADGSAFADWTYTLDTGAEGGESE